MLKLPVSFQSYRKACLRKERRHQKRVVEARVIQEERYKEHDGVYCNAQMSSKMLHDICRISDEGNQLLKTAMEKLGLSAGLRQNIKSISNDSRFSCQP